MVGRTMMINISKQLIVTFVFILFSQATYAKEYTIGLATWSGYPKCVQGFKDALKGRGLVEGSQLTFIEGEIGADKALQKTVANNFKKQNIDLVFSLTTPGTTVIKEVMPDTTPIVFSIVTYPADSGLIESFEYSGNNLVGTSNYVPLSHSIDLLLNVLPATKSVAIFHRKGEANSKIQTANLYRYFKRNNIKVVNVSVTSIDELEQKALDLINKVDVFVTTTDTLIQSGGELALIKLSLAHKIPILSANKKGITQGATFGVVADFYQLGYMAGDMAASILLNKALPESIQSKLQQPPSYLFNKNSMRKLGVNLPEQLPFKVEWTK